MKVAPPATLVIFGATGDLTRRLLIPALVNLAADGLLGPDFQIIGVGPSLGPPEADEEALRTLLDSFAPPSEFWQSLRARIGYVAGDFTGDDLFDRLKERLGDTSAAFYLAVAPRFFGSIVERLAGHGLMTERERRYRRVLIEKPFGHDLASARALNAQILACVEEQQVYRIDHFLGKETVQNILVARLTNTWLEAVWNNRYVDSVQITAAETVDVGSRGAFYDATGAMRDMVPNHLFQLLAMIAMEPPNSFDADDIRSEKAKVLRAIRQPNAAEARDAAVRGQYGSGTIGGRDIVPYNRAPDVAADSRTETYVALKLEIDTWRWAGVPFYLRTGKALQSRDTEIVITFKPVPFATFRDMGIGEIPANTLVLQLQPDERVDLSFTVKRPGTDIAIVPVNLDFAYAERFRISGRTGYETLLYDMLIGDQTLFNRADQIEAGWVAVQPFLDAWQNGEGISEIYRAGSAGPVAADDLLARDGRAWHKIGQ